MCDESKDAQAGVFELALDPATSSIFYTLVGGASSNNQGSVRRCDLRTGAIETVALASDAKTVAVYDAGVWWTSYCDPGHFPDGSANSCLPGGEGGVFSWPTTGITTTYGSPRTSTGPGAEGLAFSRSKLYVAAQTAGAAYAYTVTTNAGAGGGLLFGPNTLYIGLDRIVVDPSDDNTLYMSALDVYLLKYDILQQTVTALPYGNSSRIIRMVVDDQFVYWTTQYDSTVVRLRK